VNRGINEEPLWVHYTPQRRKLVRGKEERERERKGSKRTEGYK